MSLAALMAGRATAALNGQDYGLKILSAPTSGDELALRTVIQQTAQTRSNGLFGSLANVLGGTAPRLNFVPNANPVGSEFHGSADVAGNAINLDPLATLGLASDYSPYHDSAVNGAAHEMAHLRQTPTVLGSVPVREGGAQAFADLVTNLAASEAHIPYTTGDFDGSYAPYVSQAQQKGRDWILSGQFGRPPVSFP